MAENHKVVVNLATGLHDAERTKRDLTARPGARVKMGSNGCPREPTSSGALTMH
jgi:hypothetical protein